MARVATKVAVSIPPDLYRAVERVRRTTGKSRSTVVQDALRHWLEHQAQIGMVAEYQAGYRRRPENRREVNAAQAAAARLLATEDW
jgi:metal-responsive CopG/Arc/MetJ family transcriptional regulator